MKVDCSVCGLLWSVSEVKEVMQKVGEGKYVCPYCTSRRKRAQRRNRQGSNEK